MAEDYMEDSPGEDAPARETPAEHGDHSEGAQTFLLNSEVCPGMKPGDSLKLRIVAAHDGEYEVRYDPKEEQDESEQAGSEPAAQEPASMPQGMMD